MTYVEVGEMLAHTDWLSVGLLVAGILVLAYTSLSK